METKYDFKKNIIILAIISFIFLTFLFPNTSYGATSTIPSNVGFVNESLALRMGYSNCQVTWAPGIDHKTTYSDAWLAVKVKSTSSSFSYTNFLDLKYTNAGTIGGRSVDVNVHFNSLTVGAPYRTDTMRSDGYMNIIILDSIPIIGTTYPDGGYQAPQTYDVTTTVVWSDTQEVVELPFFVWTTDIDAGGPNAWYSEAWQGVSGFTGTYYVYPENILRNSGTTYLSAGVTTSGVDSTKKTGVCAPTVNGTCRGRYYTGNCSMWLTVFSPYSLLQTPKLSVDNSKVYQENDTITYTIDQKINTFYQDIFSKHSSFVLKDTVPDGLAYKSATVTNGAGADITNQGTLSYNEKTKEVSFSMGSTWLGNQSNYNGQTISLNIETTAKLPKTTTDTIPLQGQSVIDQNTYDTNEASITVVKPVIEITKTADKETYRSEEKISYTLTTKQTVADARADNVIVTDNDLPPGLLIDMNSIQADDATVTIEKGTNSFTAKIPELRDTSPVNITFTATLKPDALTKSEVKNKATATSVTGSETLTDEDEVDINVRNRITTQITNGTITESIEGIKIGETKTIEWNANDKYYVSEVLVDGEKVPQDQKYKGSYTFDDVRKSHSVKVTCSPIPVYTVHYMSDKGGTISGKTSESVYKWKSPEGTSKTTLDGYSFNGWISDKDVTLLDGTKIPKDKLMSMDDIKKVEVFEDLTFTAINEKNPILSLKKTADREYYDVDDTITYTVDITQVDSEAVGKNVVATDTMGDGLTLVGTPVLSGVSGTVNTTGNGWKANIPVLNYGETAKITFTAKPSPELAGENAINTAEATVDRGTGASGTSIVHIAKPQMSVTKTSDKTVAQPQDIVTYTITVDQVNEKAIAKNVVVEDTLPEKFKLIDISCDRGTVNKTSDTYFTVTFDTFAYNDPVEIIYTVEVLETIEEGEKVNEVSAICDYGDPANTDNTVEITRPVVTVEKAANKEYVQQGDAIDFTVKVKQTNPKTTGKNVVVIDDLPAGLELAGKPVLSGADGEIILGENAWEAKIPELAYGQDAVITYTAKALPYTEEHSEAKNEALVSVRNGQPANATDTVHIEKPVITATKTVDQEYAQIGDILEYTVTVKQDNPDTAGRNVVIKDNLPDELQLIEPVKITGTNEKAKVSGNDWELNLDELPYGETINITYHAKILDPGHEITSAHIIENSLQAYCDHSDVSSPFAITKLMKPVLNIEKSTEKDLYQGYETVKYTINVNQENENLTGRDIAVQDVLPKGMSFAGEPEVNIPAHVNVKGNILNVTINELPYGETAVIEFEATMDETVIGKDVTNKATGSIENGESVHDETTFHVPQPHMEISKTCNVEKVQPGDVVEFTVTAIQTNEKAIAKDVVITDSLPEGFELMGIGFKSNGKSFTSTQPYVPYGKPVVITYKTKVQDYTESGSHVNIAEMTYDYAEKDETAKCAVEVVRPSFEVFKTSDVDIVQIGDEVTYTVKINQTTPGTEGRNVVIKDNLPPQLQLTTAPEINGTVGDVSVMGNSFEISIPKFEAAQAVVTYKARVIEESEDIVNLVSVSAHAAAPVTAEDHIRTETPGLVIEKTVDKPSVQPGDILTYKVLVSQSNLDIPSRNVVVTNTIPEELKFSGEVKVTGVDAEVTTEENSWRAEIAELSEGTIAVFEYEVTAIAELSEESMRKDIESGAQAVCENGEPVTATAETVIIKPELDIKKEADKNTCELGDTVKYTIAAIPRNDTAARNVEIRDILPDGLELKGPPTLMGVDGSVMTNKKDITISIKALEPGQLAVVEYETVANKVKSEVVNTATASCDNGKDVSASAAISVKEKTIIPMVPTGDDFKVFAIAAVMIASLIGVYIVRKKK